MSASLPPEPASFPIFLRLVGARVVVVGGGAEALAKVRLLLSSGARVCVMSASPDEELRAMAEAGRIVLAEPSGDGLSAKPAFDASTPLLPPLLPAPGFVF